jgi:hypothetical protein
VAFYFLFANCSISSRSRLPLALVAVHRAEDLTAEQLTYDEKCFGDHRVGRRAWELRRPVLLAVPVVLIRSAAA